MVKKSPVGLLGISVGKKYFTDRDVIKAYLNYLESYFEESHILLADLPKIHNLMAIDGLKYSLAYKKVILNGNSLEGQIRKVGINSNVKVHRWSEFMDSNYQHNLEILTEAYNESDKFRSDVDEVVGNFLTSTKADVKIALPISKNYFLEELALLNSIQLYFARPLVELYPGRNEVQEKIQENEYVFAHRLKKDPLRKFHEVYGDKGIIYSKEKRGVGQTLYANRPFERDELIFTVSGPIVTKPSIYTVPIYHDLFIDPENEGKQLCHSCEPSAGIKNRNQVVAIKDIVPGDEITIDYAMIVPRYNQLILAQDLACKCGSRTCRGELGSWEKLPENLKHSYKGYVSDYLIS